MVTGSAGRDWWTLRASSRAAAREAMGPAGETVMVAAERELKANSVALNSEVNRMELFRTLLYLSEFEGLARRRYEVRGKAPSEAGRIVCQVLGRVNFTLARAAATAQTISNSVNT